MATDRPSVLKAVQRVLEEHLTIKDVDEATHLFRDLELDSIQQLTFVVELENHYKICFDEGDESGIQTIGDVVDAVIRRLDEA